MTDKHSRSNAGVSPAWFGTASLVAACLAWASVWLAFNQGPDGLATLGVVVGIQRRSWLGIITGAIGLAMIGYEAWFLLMSR